MAHISHKWTKPLEITVVFEPTRFAQDAVRTAYAALVPAHTRRLTVTERRLDDHALADSEGRPVGGNRS